MLVESSGCYQNDTGCVYTCMRDVATSLVRVACDLTELIGMWLFLSVFYSENTSKMWETACDWCQWQWVCVVSLVLLVDISDEECLYGRRQWQG